MSLNYWEPGWTGVLADGTKVKTVIDNEVPEEYWESIRVAIGAGKLRATSSWMVGASADGKDFRRASTLPEKKNLSGDAMYPGSGFKTTVVPLPYLGPEVNEWGEVCP